MSALMAAMCWGFAPFLEKAGLRATNDPSVGLIIRSAGVLIGTLCILPFFSQLPTRLADVPLRHILFIAGGGILASLVGQAFFYRALKFGELSKTVVIGASYPLVACLLGLLFLHEPLTLKKAAGILSVMLGIVLLK